MILEIIMFVIVMGLIGIVLGVFIHNLYNSKDRYSFFSNLFAICVITFMEYMLMTAIVPLILRLW